MNALEKYLEQKRITKEVTEGIRKSLGLNEEWEDNSSRNDKACITWHNGAGREYDVTLRMRMHYGWYGDSSTYSCNSDEMTGYMLRAMNMLRREIAMMAKELAEKDLRKAKEEAQEIAKEILADNK